MKNVKVSIIITTYNSKKFITKAIESVLNQTYQNFECIIIDDGSKDNTKDSVEPFLLDDRMQYVYHDNVGISATRNKGIDMATGDYLLFFDVDDLLPNTAVDDLVILAKKYPNTDFVFGKTGETKGQNNAVYKTQRHDLPKHTELNNNNLNLLKSTFKNRVMNNVAWNKLYKLPFLKKHNLKFKEGIIHEDELWGFEILYYAKSIVLNDSITYYYNTDNDQSITKNYTIFNLKCFLTIISIIYTNYYLQEKNSIKKNIIAAYLTKLKMLSISHTYNQLVTEEKKSAHSIVEKTFRKTIIDLNDISFLRHKEKKRYKAFLTVQNMNPTFIKKYLLLTRKIRFNPKKILQILNMRKEAKKQLTNY